MKIHDYTLVAARPHNSQTQAQFTDAVMARITNRGRSNRLLTTLRHSPVMLTMLFVLALLFVSGTAYAISYLWPQLVPTVSRPTTSTSGRTLVIADNCGQANAQNRYELKKNAPVTADKLNDVVKAQCELQAVSSWAQKTYQTPNTQSIDDVNRPGLVMTHTTVMPAAIAVQVVSIDANTIKVRDSQLSIQTIPYTKETQMVIDGQYSSIGRLASGDVIAYVNKTIVTTKNRADCTKVSCFADTLSTSTETTAIIKLSYSLDTYRAISYLVESMHCEGNPDDDCPSTSSMDVFMGDASTHGYTIDNSRYAQSTGVVQNYSDSVIVLKTSSGRLVSLYTPWNLIEQVNNSGKSNKINIGDTLQIDYMQDAGTKNDTEISWQRVWRVSLLLEAANKAGPYYNY